MPPLRPVPPSRWPRTPNPQSAIRNPQSYNGLLRSLSAVERRLRLVEAVRGLPTALAVGLALAVVPALAARAGPLLPPEGVALLALALVGLALLVRAGVAFARPRPPIATARQADALLGLDEKVATAVALHESLPTRRPELLAAQLTDAERSLAAALPGLPSRAGLWPSRLSLVPPLLLALLFGAALLAPNPLQGYWDQQAATHKQQQAEADKIDQLRKDLAARPGAQDSARQQLLAELDQLHHDLQASDLNRDQAVARLSQAEAALQQQVDAQAPAEQAALDAMSSALGEQNGPLHDAAAALKRDDTKAAADALKKAAADASKLSPEQRQAMAQALDKAANDAAANDPALARRLEDASRALQSSDTQAAQTALAGLADQVDKTGQNLTTQQQLNQALSQIQSSKNNVADAGQQASSGTPGPTLDAAQQSADATALAGATPLPTLDAAQQSAEATALAGTTPIAGTPIAGGTPLALGTPVALGTPGTPGQGTPVLVPGQGQGQGQMSGQGQGQGQGQGPSGNQGAGVGGSQAGNQHTEPVAVPPSTLNAQGTPVGLTARQNTGETGVTAVNGGASTGSAQVPYQQVFGSYNSAAQKNLDTTYIPAGMKDMVRRYFTAITPDK
ncbi:MAG: hypothetical protein ACR2M0_16780 [Chloroflexia bacterium]